MWIFQYVHKLYPLCLSHNAYIVSALSLPQYITCIRFVSPTIRTSCILSVSPTMRTSVSPTQMGSFVPADSAHLGVTDSLFARVGASDNVVKHMSTFHLEMTEVAHILTNATSKSFVILDEIGELQSSIASRFRYSMCQDLRVGSHMYRVCVACLLVVCLFTCLFFV